MKKLLCITILFATTTVGFAQTKSINDITQQYLQIQSALANDDAEKASAAAADFSKQATNIPMQGISDKLHPTFMQQQKALIANSQSIASTKDIKTQRKAFAALSNSMITLAKADKISSSTVYEDYCPMQKASWLSAQKTIRNPYYGAEMLDCGKVTKSY
ncbi:MAG: DUF3347 domain-containing protein [Chitinophagaceae bacterium]